MPTTARVARIHEYGPPEVLRFDDIVVGEPGDDEALIRNTVIGLDAIATGILKVDPSNLYPCSQLIEAHHDLEERRTTGAAVLRVTAGSPLIKFHALQRPKTPAAPVHETMLN